MAEAASECRLPVADEVIEVSMSAEAAIEVTLALSGGSDRRNGRNSSSSSSADDRHTAVSGNGQFLHFSGLRTFLLRNF